VCYGEQEVNCQEIVASLNHDYTDLQDGQDSHLPEPCASGSGDQPLEHVIPTVPEDKPGEHSSCSSSHPENPGSDNQPAAKEENSVEPSPLNPTENRFALSFC
jgi:hypothetical protein